MTDRKGSQTRKRIGEGVRVHGARGLNAHGGLGARRESKMPQHLYMAFQMCGWLAVHLVPGKTRGRSGSHHPCPPKTQNLAEKNKNPRGCS